MSSFRRWSGTGRTGFIDKAQLMRDFERKFNHMLSVTPTDTRVDLFWVLDELYKAQTISTKEVKYFDEEEKVWKIGSVIVDA